MFGIGIFGTEKAFRELTCWITMILISQSQDS